jgi:NADH:ubiquinone oxidoreductase subunit F (NADH-binding)
MGTPLKKIVYDIGGGIPGGKAFKAVQTGGPSGGCVPESLIDLPVDFEKLKQAGSMMGSGGMIILDEDTCMVDVARYFLTFLVQESCGKCVPCRVGVKRMYEIVDRICAGLAVPEDLAELEQLGSTMQEAALCGLGKSAPNPVLSTLKYFRHEYEAHVHEKRCPAKVCKPLIRYEIDTDKCTGCGVCRRKCPETAIIGEKLECHCIDEELCVRCGICIDSCKFGAIFIE